MLYLDTCVLLAVLLPEAHSATAAAFLEQARAPLAISSWSVTELHSALGLKVRSNALSTSQAEAVLLGFERGLSPALMELELEAQDFRNANACLRGWRTGLRAGDALHLAIASGRGAILCSLDEPFVAAAQQLGLEAELLSTGGGLSSDQAPR